MKIQVVVKKSIKPPTTLELSNVPKLTSTDNAEIQVKLKKQYLVQETKRHH